MNYPDELTPAIYAFAEKNYKMFITDLFTDDEYYDLKHFLLYLFNHQDENFMEAMIHLVTCIITKEINPETNEQNELNELLDNIITRISETMNKFNESHKLNTLAKLNILKKNYQSAIDSNIGEQIINCHSFVRMTIDSNRGFSACGNTREKLEKKLNFILTKEITHDVSECEKSEEIVQEAVELDETFSDELVELDTNSDDNF
jgi:hypothetical protein